MNLESNVLKNHPDLFGKVSINDFMWAYNIISTRCFGYYVPNSTMLVPLADNANHEDQTNCSYYTVHDGLEKDPQ